MPIRVLNLNSDNLSYFMRRDLLSVGIAFNFQQDSAVNNVATDNVVGSDGPEPTVSDATQRVLDVAERLFMQRGYAAITLRDIAQALDMKQASLYYHFPGGKEQLFVTVVQRVLERYKAGIHQALATHRLDLRQQLMAIALWFAQQPPMNLLGLMHADIPALSQASQAELLDSVFVALFAPIRNTFAAAQQIGTIRTVDPDMITGAFLAIMDGISYRQAHSDEISPEVMAQEMISVLLDGLHPAT
ncbi:MAG: TetR/AcrR family transcriptional regulator [Caldilineaceae bacterium]|nr:TetR/AcrR family transcriptional regulator [Caldilineaceae bacterium]MCB0142593.1 TetR/AcrR family transcriptional regulator [Caldilineaceae bacterium]